MNDIIFCKSKHCFRSFIPVEAGKRMRVLIAGTQHETHTFAEEKTDRSDPQAERELMFSLTISVIFHRLGVGRHQLLFCSIAM